MQILKNDMGAISIGDYYSLTYSSTSKSEWCNGVSSFCMGDTGGDAACYGAALFVHDHAGLCWVGGSCRPEHWNPPGS